MPSINRVRLNNIKYSHGEKYYDDFILDVEGKSFLISFDNGGGKTFLAQCIMQTILPKSHFTPKHPIEELFDNENNNNVIHSLVEWKLDEGSEYEYLITGFCAKKKNPTDSNSSNLEGKSKFTSFNYVYLYNKNANYNIENIPLKKTEGNNIIRMNYSELRKFLRDLDGDSCFAKVFDTKSEYSKLLRDFKINTTEWELMKDANYTEAYLPHFLGKYSTAKSFLQDFLIPQIDKANELHNQGDYQNSEDRAESLLDIKETLVDYSKRIEDKKELDKLEIALSELLSIDEQFLRVFNDRELVKTNMVKSYNKLKNDISSAENKIDELKLDIESINNEESELDDKISKHKEEISVLEDNRDKLKNEIETFNMYKSINTMKKHKERLDITTQELETKKLEISKQEDAAKLLDEQELLFKAEDKYVSYLKEQSDLLEYNETKENHEKSKSELLKKLEKSGGEYKFLLEKEHDNTSLNISALDKKEFELNDTLKIQQAERDNILSEIAKLKSQLENLNSNTDSLKSTKENLIKDLRNTLNSLNINSSINNDISTFSSSLVNDIKSALCINEELFDIENVDKFIEDILFKIGNITKDSVNTMIEDKNELTKFSNILDTILKSEDKVFENSFELNVNAVGISNLKDQVYSLINETKNKIDYTTYNAKGILDNLKETKNTLDGKLYKKTEEQKSLKIKIEELNNEISEINNSLNIYKEELDNLSSILKKYNSETVYSLNKVLIESKTNKAIAINNLSNKQQLLEQELEKLKSNKGLVLKDTIEECYFKIKERYPNALLGVDFLKSLSESDKKMYLEKTDSLIAYSILLSSEDFVFLNRNSNFISKYKDELIPIMNIDSMKTRDKIELNDLYLTRRSTDEILDEDRINREIERKKIAIENVIVEITSEREMLLDLESDLDKINQFIMKYNETYMKDLLEEIDTKSNNVEDLSNKEANIEKEVSNLKELQITNEHNRTEISKFINNLNNSIKKIDIFKENMDNSLDVINKSYEEHQSVLNTIEEFNKATIQRNIDLRDIINTTNKVKDLELAKESVDNNIQILGYEKQECINSRAEFNSDLKNIKDLIKTLNFKSLPTENLSLIKAEAIYNSALESSIGEIRDLKQVNDIIARTKERISGIEKEILDFGHSVDEFKNSNKIFKLHSNIDYDNLKIKKKSISNTLKILNDEAFEIRDNINTIKGAITHIKEEVLNKYKVDAETFIVPDIDIEESIKGNKENIAKIKKDISEFKNYIQQIELATKELKEDKKNLDNEIDGLRSLSLELDKLKNSVEGIIKSFGIDTSITSECADNLDYIQKDKSSNISLGEKKLKVSDSNIKMLQNKHKKKVEDTKNSLENSVFQIKDDLDEIIPPATLEDTKMQIEAINGPGGYLTLLGEEKSTLESDLIALEESQSTFIELCVQRANYAYDKLKDIEDFSKVQIGDKKQETIRVKLNILPKEEQVIKMRNYINKIITESENSKYTREDKIKLLSKSLELKNMFPQILENIDRCKVEIFKINDTCDGGKFLSWGKAGSTGQTNSMYLYIFMCIMTFIRRLSSYDIKDKSRQLIFLDNPFAGTVNLNLWKIPVDLMKKNDIQFMCLGFDVPPELTGMFDVRYMLGNKRLSTNVQMVDVVNKEVVSRRENTDTYSIFDLDTIVQK